MWRERTMRQRVTLIMRYLFWPAIVLSAAVYFTFHNGAAIRRRMGKGIIRQMADQIGLAARLGILSPWYYMFELYHEHNLKRAAAYLNRYETKYNLYEFLKIRVERTDGALLNNKALFASLCAKNEIPTAPVVAVARNGELRPPDDWDDTGSPERRPVLPGRDLFIKPMAGKGGRGTLRARYLGGGRYQLSDGQTFGRDALACHLGQLSRTQALVIQHCLVNHHDLLDLCAGALSCVRTVTCKNRDGGFEVTNAAFRMAMRNDTTVDGLHRGGMVSKVDLDTGALGQATDLGFRPHIGWRDINPHTGVQITGRVLPMWDDLKALAERAHAAFPHKVAVGWDIAITEDGPVIVEGNGSPCVDIIQRVDEPMGNGRFGELLAYHIIRGLDAKPVQESLAASPASA